MRPAVTDRRSRRMVLLVAIAATFGSAAPARGQVAPNDICYWRRTQGATCRSGRLQERWCEFCHGDGGPTPTRCEWRTVGPC